MTDDLLTILVNELDRLFQPLRAVVENPLLLDRLLAELGASSQTAGSDTLATALSSVVDLGRQIDGLANGSAPSFQGIADLLSAAGKAFDAVKALSEAGGPAAALETLGGDLVSLLLSTYLTVWHPVVRQIAVLLTLLEPVETEPMQPAMVDANNNVLRMPYRVTRFHLDRIRDLLRDPVGTLRTYYVNDLQTIADADAMADKLFPRVLGVLRALGVSCRYGYRPGDEPLLGDAAPLVSHALIVYAADKLAGSDVDAGVVLLLSPAERGDLGLLVTPFGTLTLTTQPGQWAVELDLTADVQAFAYGRHGATILASAATAEIDAQMKVTLTAPFDDSAVPGAPPVPTTPAFILGAANGSHIEIGSAAFGLQTSLSEAKQSLALSAEGAKSAIVIAPGDGDGFLSSVLPANGMRATFDLGLAWSSGTGLTFLGAGGLDATLPVVLSIGGVLTVPSVHPNAFGALAPTASFRGPLCFASKRKNMTQHIFSFESELQNTGEAAPKTSPSFSISERLTRRVRI